MDIISAKSLFHYILLIRFFGGLGAGGGYAKRVRLYARENNKKRWTIPKDKASSSYSAFHDQTLPYTEITYNVSN